MANYNQFAFLENGKLDRFDPASFVPGSFNLWFPFIEFERPCRLGEALWRYVGNDMREGDQQMFYTFFHEYLHLVQSAMYFVCQLPILLTHQIIHDIRVTAIKRGNGGCLLPIIHSEEFVTLCKLFNEEFASESVLLHQETNKKFSVVNIAEGVARLLEEAFRGHVVETDNYRYTAIRDLNAFFLHERALNHRQLLDVCDVALRRRKPAKTFVEILQALSKCGQNIEKFDFESISTLADELGCEFVQSGANVVAFDTDRMFNSPIFAHYVRHIKSLYLGLPKCFTEGAVLSPIFDEVVQDNGAGLPTCMLRWIVTCGSTVILNSAGEMELFDANKQYASPLDQNIVGIKAVVDSIIKCRHACYLKQSCCRANGFGNNLPVDEDCDSSPWRKQPIGGLVCPYSAIWKALGLDGFVP